MKTKVFCIGFHKTGTTSLAEAFRILGYRVTGPNGVDDPKIADNVLPMARRLISKYDVFQDNPWPIIFKYIDANYPDSKFILTTRNSDSWIKSQVSHFGKTETPMRQWIYGFGCPQGNEDVYVKRYESHNAEVVDYFKNRPNDLLVMDLSSGSGWDEICPFLGIDKPNTQFPHINKASDRDGNVSLGRLLADRVKKHMNRRRWRKA